MSNSLSCQFCHQLPHHVSCPNAPEPQPVLPCENCGEDIYEGELYYDLPAEKLCRKCIKDSETIAEIEVFINE